MRTYLLFFLFIQSLNLWGLGEPCGRFHECLSPEECTNFICQLPDPDTHKDHNCDPACIFRGTTCHYDECVPDRTHHCFLCKNWEWCTPQSFPAGTYACELNLEEDVFGGLYWVRDFDIGSISSLCGDQSPCHDLHRVCNSWQENETIMGETCLAECVDGYHWDGATETCVSDTRQVACSLEDFPRAELHLEDETPVFPNNRQYIVTHILTGNNLVTETWEETAWTRNISNCHWSIYVSHFSPAYGYNDRCSNDINLRPYLYFDGEVKGHTVNVANTSDLETKLKRCLASLPQNDLTCATGLNTPYQIIDCSDEYKPDDDNAFWHENYRDDGDGNRYLIVEGEYYNGICSFNNLSTSQCWGCKPGYKKDPAGEYCIENTDTVGIVSDQITELINTQSDLVEGIIKADYQVVLRGKIMDRDNNPLPGIEVTVVGHPDLGHVITNENGEYTMVANGGGTIVVEYNGEAQEGAYLPVQRKIKTRWNEFAWADDAVMIPYRDGSDVSVTDKTIINTTLTTGVEESDNGSRPRTARLLFQAGTIISGKDGEVIDLENGNMSVIATEFTVGNNGPKAMPGPLPASTAYTYAVDFSIQGLENKWVEFKDNAEDPKPVYAYVDNFLKMPVGETVPSGYYDREKSRWVPSPSGKVISILYLENNNTEAVVCWKDTMNASDCTAELRVGDTNLDTYGFSNDELRLLAGMYNVNTENTTNTFWRVPVTHFTAYDFNWPMRCGEGTGECLPPDPGEPVECDGCEHDGSIINVQKQTLGETIPVAGTNHRLFYQSNRVPGYKKGFTKRIIISRDIQTALNRGLEKVTITYYIGGYRNEVVLTKSDIPDDQKIFVYDIDWNGIVNGPTLKREERLIVDVGFSYPFEYEPAGEYFGEPTTGTKVWDTIVDEREGDSGMITYWNRIETTIGVEEATKMKMGGWTLDVLHHYSPDTGIVHLGDGTTLEKSEAIQNKLEWIGGNNNPNNNITDALTGENVKNIKEVMLEDGNTTDMATDRYGRLYLLNHNMSNDEYFLSQIKDAKDENEKFYRAIDSRYLTTEIINDNLVGTSIGAFHPVDITISGDTLYILNYEPDAGSILKVTLNSEGGFTGIEKKSVYFYTDSDNVNHSFPYTQDHRNKLVVNSEGVLYLLSAGDDSRGVYRVNQSGEVKQLLISCGSGIVEYDITDQRAFCLGDFSLITMAISPDDELYLSLNSLSDVSNNYIYKFENNKPFNESLVKVVGSGEEVLETDNRNIQQIPLLDLPLLKVIDMDFDQLGNLYFSQKGEMTKSRILKLASESKYVTIVAGGCGVMGYELNAPGSCFQTQFSYESYNNKILDDAFDYYGHFDSSVQNFELNNPTSYALSLSNITVSPDGGIYFYDERYGVIWGMGGVKKGDEEIAYVIPSKSGMLAYSFDGEGNHLNTRSTITGQVLYTFNYDQKTLLSIENAHGQKITVEDRDNGRIKILKAPSGDLTTLTYNGDYLESVSMYGGDRTFSMKYDDTLKGLLIKFTRGGKNTQISNEYIYDKNTGLLKSDQFGNDNPQIIDAKDQFSETGVQTFTLKTAMEYETTYKSIYSHASDDDWKAATECNRWIQSCERNEAYELTQVAIGPQGQKTVALHDKAGMRQTIFQYGAGNVTDDGVVADKPYTRMDIELKKDPRFGTEYVSFKKLSLPGFSSGTDGLHYITSNTIDIVNDSADLMAPKTYKVCDTDRCAEYSKENSNVMISRIEGEALKNTTEYLLNSNFQVKQVNNLENTERLPIKMSYYGSGIKNGKLFEITQGENDTERKVKYDYYSDAEGHSGRLKTITRYWEGVPLITTFSYDDFNRIKIKQLPDDRILEFTYDDFNNIKTITTPKKDEEAVFFHEFTTDIINHASTYIPALSDSDLNTPETGNTLYGYNQDRQVTTITLPDNKVIGFNYGAENTTSGEAVGLLNNISVEDITKISFKYKKGELTEVSAGNESILFSYIIRTYFNNNNGFDSKGYSLLSEFNGFLADYRLENITNPITMFSMGERLTKGDHIFLTFHEGNSSEFHGNTHIKHESPGENIYLHSHLLFEYDDLNKELTNIDYALVEGISKKSKIREEFGYNNFGEVDSRTIKMLVGDQDTLWESSYDRNRLGKITQVTENGVTLNYEFNRRGQLVKVTDVNGDLREEYSYDANGNRTIISYWDYENNQNVPYSGEETKVTAQDQLTDFNQNHYDYDANGYVSGCGNRADASSNKCTFSSLVYDVFGNLTDATGKDDEDITYTIDPLNRRIGKKIGEVEQYKLIYKDQLNPLAMEAGGVISYFVYSSKGHVPDYILRGEKIYRVISDHLGSVRKVIDITTITEPKTVQAITYDTWGKVVTTQYYNEDGNAITEIQAETLGLTNLHPFGFAGGLYDGDTGLVRFGARDYDPYTGRWTAKDPIRFKGGTTNLYGYCSNDPVNFVDVTGLLMGEVEVEFDDPDLMSDDFDNSIKDVWRNADWRLFAWGSLKVAAGSFGIFVLKGKSLGTGTVLDGIFSADSYISGWSDIFRSFDAKSSVANVLCVFSPGGVLREIPHAGKGLSGLFGLAALGKGSLSSSLKGLVGKIGSALGNLTNYGSSIDGIGGDIGDISGGGSRPQDSYHY